MILKTKNINWQRTAGAVIITAAACFFIWGFAAPVKKSSDVPASSNDGIINNTGDSCRVNGADTPPPAKKKCC